MRWFYLCLKINDGIETGRGRCTLLSNDLQEAKRQWEQINTNKNIKSPWRSKLYIYICMYECISLLLQWSDTGMGFSKSLNACSYSKSNSSSWANYCNCAGLKVEFSRDLFQFQWFCDSSAVRELYFISTSYIKCLSCSHQFSLASLGRKSVPAYQ